MGSPRGRGGGRASGQLSQGAAPALITVANARGSTVISKVDDLDNVASDKLSEARKVLREMSVGRQDANLLYQRCFQLLKLGGLEAEIPRLVVFGQQSMGKTTLLDYIMGGPIGYSSTDTGTMMPVVIMLKPIEKSAVTPVGAVMCKMNGASMNIRELQTAMKKVMTSTKTVLAEELELEIAVPGGVHAVFVDLPGIKDDSKEGAELTRAVVRNYVRNNPNDLYILVKKSSDDPANWPWSLREFILTSPPRGLGLTPRQTIVVGTRARDFLINEKNDIRTDVELLSRVQKRAVRDSAGEALPLYLLELFSLSMEDKEKSDFLSKRSAMQRQIVEGRLECLDLLSSGFESTSHSASSQLQSFFDVDVFRADLNSKFQSLVHEQLAALERKLVRRRLELQKLRTNTETELAERNSQSVRESMKLFLRELLTVITELVTGNYMIIRLNDHGEKFLNMYGGSLFDNLEEGHRLAVDLFAARNQYDPTFLEKIRQHEELFLEKQEKERSALLIAAFPLDPAARSNVEETPNPHPSGRFQPGQYVRFIVARDRSYMLGHIISMEDVGVGDASALAIGAGGTAGSAGSSSAAATGGSSAFPYKIAFYFVTEKVSGEQIQSKQVDQSRLNVLLPLHSLLNPSALPPRNFRCWVRTLRSDSWVGVVPAMLRHIQIDAELPAPLDAAGVGIPQAPMSGTVQYVPLAAAAGTSSALDGEPLDDRHAATAPLSHVFCDPETLTLGAANPFEGTCYKSMTRMQRIAGEFADTKLLNQLALTYLGRWLKFHLAEMEPDRRFSDHVLLQLMRSVKHVIDKADWEPLVADLLQANVRSGLLNLARLASCATAVALRRILKAAIHEVVRLIRAGDLPRTLCYLADSPRFVEEVDRALEAYCRTRAESCAHAMRDLIFEQTHAIHFEMIEDFFDGCRLFEREFLHSSLMDDISRRVRDALALRKAKLGGTDIYARHAGGVSQEMIYEEVRIQFWVAKQLLAAPLTTKLYIQFVKDVKDKSHHLAADEKFSSSECDLERSLQEQILNEQASPAPGARTVPRTDEELMLHFDLQLNREDVAERAAAYRRAEEYTRITLEGVSKLRNQIQKEGGVNFLTRLNLTSIATSGGGASPAPPQSDVSTAPSTSLAASRTVTDDVG